MSDIVTKALIADNSSESITVDPREVTNLYKELEATRKDRDHWKANHDEAVKRCAL